MILLSMSRVILTANVILGIVNHADFHLAITRDLGCNKGGISPTYGTGNCSSLSFGITFDLKRVFGALSIDLDIESKLIL